MDGPEHLEEEVSQEHTFGTPSDLPPRSSNHITVAFNGHNADQLYSSYDPTDNILLESRSRALQARLPRPQDDTSVCFPFLRSHILATVIICDLHLLLYTTNDLVRSDVAAFQSYLNPILHAVRNPSSLMSGTPSSSAFTPEAILSRIRNMDRAQFVSAGVLTAEVLGFFTVGEMVGRLKVVGYNGDVHHHETATPHDGA
ncbi:ATP synthase subunit G atp20 [Xylographa bjoerkii]|nr:ATP synthase subunit G atp20 [Xylographa bjoerkii]